MTRVERRPLLGPRRPAPRGRFSCAAAARAIAALALTVLAGLVVVAFVPQALGFSAHVVTSGSMAPRVEPGDVVLTRPTTAAELRAGQVLLFADPDRPGGLLLHRLVSFDAHGRLVTRGDANQSDDSVHVPVSAVRGVARLRVPWVGLPAVWRAQGRLGLIALAAALLAGAAVFVVAGRGRRGADGPEQIAGQAQPGSSVRTPAPMTGVGVPTGAQTAARPGTEVHDTRVVRHTRAVPGPYAGEEGRGSASSTGYRLPPVPPAVPRAGGRSSRPAGPAGSRRRPAGDHTGCFDRGRLCGQPRL